MPIPARSDRRFSAALPAPLPDSDDATIALDIDAVAAIAVMRDVAGSLERLGTAPLSLLAVVGKRLKITATFADRDACGAERLARSLAKIDGVGRVRLERVCPRRGRIYAIWLVNRLVPW